MRIVSKIICFLILLSFSMTFAEMPLELIQVFSSDTYGALLIERCLSPGDLNNDGYSDIFVGEIGNRNDLFVYSGGNPPNLIPEMIFSGGHGNIAWINDINNDSIKDFVVKRAAEPTYEIVEIWLGGIDFLQKTEADYTITQGRDTVSGLAHQIYSGDVNGDNQNDLVLSAVNMELPPFEGRLYIYYGGDLLDSICDEVINFYRHDDGYDGFYQGSGPIGDINSDGLLDYAINWHKNSNDTSYVAILLGEIPFDTVPDYIIPTPFEDGIYRVPNQFGVEIVALGDINKDGYDDFAVGGSTLWPCIFYGGEPFNINPIILGDTTDDLTQGDRIANIGDINHDSYDDIGVGWISYHLGSGIVSIYFGSSNMNTEADIIIPYNLVEPTPGMHFGYKVGPAGDFNGDDVDDLIISSRETWGSGAIDHGRVYVYAGDRNLPTPAEDETENPVPEQYNILEQNYPNPFNNQTIIEYELWGSFEREIELSIYNILGQNIRKLYQGIQSSGRHVTYWDGKDQFGKPVSSGIYFYKLTSQNQTLSKKMIFLK